MPAKGYAAIAQDEGEIIQEKSKAPSSKLSRVVPWAPFICATLLFIVLSAIFVVPSTLYIYLSFLAVYSSAGVASILSRICLGQRCLPFSSAMGIALVLLLMPSLLPSRVSESKYSTTSELKESRKNSDVLFIAANLYNSEAIIPSFTKNLFQLADILGHDNVFISIYESNSFDKTKSLLTTFDSGLSEMQIPHHIQLDDTHNHIGWEGAWSRVEFLANVRNKVYDVLDTPKGIPYKSRIKKVLWLNDIYFTPETVLRLLDTNNGKFDVACGLDYISIGIYDTWVMRDEEYIRPKPIWPHFNRTEDVTRMRNGDLIPVRSCWNGIAAYDADLVIDTGRNPPYSKPTDPNVKWPIRFRPSRDCLTSECLAINLDIHLLLKDIRQPVIFISPRVQVAYTRATYFLYTRLMHWRIVAPWHIIWEDWISYRLLGFVTDIGRKPSECSHVFKKNTHAYKGSSVASIQAS